ncbi:MAG: hypothetical protein PHE55_17275 [Methylococcaceae bacterium]|nr:hypothetical protein [Methylococcaceae bacterium]
MRAVWSLWTKPFKHGRCYWASEFHHLLGWVLSVETARKHYPETMLVTDDAGAEMLVEGIGLQFDHVSTALNELNFHDPAWWAFGKMYAYRLQEQPFVHIDSDVFLWNRLPERLESASVFAQNPEYHNLGSTCYHPEQIEHAIRSVNGWIPDEIDYYMPVDGVFKAACCGIMGGSRVDFIRHYADLAITMMEHPDNQAAWLSLNDRMSLSLIFEQYFLTACVEYHKGKQDSPYGNIHDEYLFESMGDAHEKAALVGFTHLLGATKQNKQVSERLEKRIMKDYPKHYERCLRFIR